jgi:hypothetical protein
LTLQAIGKETRQHSGRSNSGQSTGIEGVMGLWRWFTGRGAAHVDPRLRRWREHWTKAAASVDHGEIARLARDLDAFQLPDDEIEIEREMLQALIDREQLASSTRDTGLPKVETGHRVVRGERCHYSEPASMPDAGGQPSGRLLLTANRALFVGSGKTVAAAWHTISAAVHAERDVVLVRNGGGHAYRFRCNSYGDALRATFIAEKLLEPRRPPMNTNRG